MSGGSWVCQSCLLLFSEPPGPGTGPLFHQELRLRPWAPQCGRRALGCDSIPEPPWQASRILWEGDSLPQPGAWHLHHIHPQPHGHLYSLRH